MSFFTPGDASYIKSSVRRLIQLTAVGGIGLAKGYGQAKDVAERDAELARLEAFIDGCTLTGRKE